MVTVFIFYDCSWLGISEQNKFLMRKFQFHKMASIIEMWQLRNFLGFQLLWRSGFQSSGLWASTSCLLPHRCDPETTQVLAGLLKHNQQRWALLLKEDPSQVTNLPGMTILIGIKGSPSELQWPKCNCSLSCIFECRQRRKLCCALAHYSDMSQMGVIREIHVRNSEWFDGISASLAEGPDCVFLFPPVGKKAFGVLNLNLFALLFLLYSWYSWIKYVDIFSFGCFSKVWKLDEVKNID